MPLNRETKIIWLNWLEMFREAENREDEDFVMLSAYIWQRIREKCGEDNLIEWASGELCEDIGFDQTVLYHIRNTDWPWKTMMDDLQVISAGFPEVIFQITFIEGDHSAKTYLHSGHLTAVLYDGDTGSLILAF